MKSTTLYTIDACIISNCILIYYAPTLPGNVLAVKVIKVMLSCYDCSVSQKTTHQKTSVVTSSLFYISSDIVSRKESLLIISNPPKLNLTPQSLSCVNKYSQLTETNGFGSLFVCEFNKGQNNLAIGGLGGSFYPRISLSRGGTGPPV